MTFVEWLARQTRRRDAVGDLARDARRDPTWPSRGKITRARLARAPRAAGRHPRGARGTGHRVAGVGPAAAGRAGLVGLVRGLRGAPPADGLRCAPLHARPPDRIHESRGGVGVRRGVGERPLGLLDSVARRACRARRDPGAFRPHDPGDDRRAGRRPGTHHGGEEPRCRRSSLRWSTRRRCRTRLLRGRLRGRRGRLRRAMAALRGGDRCAPGPVVCRPRTVRRSVLLDRRHPPRAPAGPAGGTADLGGKLGLGCRAPSGRPPRRRVAGVRLQHHAGAVRDGMERTPSRADRARSIGGGLPERTRDDVVLHHRRPYRSRPRPHRTGRAHRAPAGGDPAARVCRSGRRSCSPRSCRRSRAPACSGCSSGRSPTRCASSSGSGTRSGRSWRRADPGVAMSHGRLGRRPSLVHPTKGRT